MTAHFKEDDFVGLSVRARNGLRAACYWSRAEIEEAIQGGTFKYERMRNFGKKSFEEVLVWMGRDIPKKQNKTCPHCGKGL